MHQLIYLTGAPASGKSTAARAVSDLRSDVEIFEYGLELTKRISQRERERVEQDDLRELSSKIITEKDVQELDEYLLQYVTQNLSHKHILIDSHPVTKEAYGYRITGFSPSQLATLPISKIVVLFCSAEETKRRIASAAGGRPQVSAFEADFHTYLQGAMAASYATAIGVPVYLLDSGLGVEATVMKITQLLGPA